MESYFVLSQPDLFSFPSRYIINVQVFFTLLPYGEEITL